MSEARLGILYVIDTGRPPDSAEEPRPEEALARATVLAEKENATADVRIVSGDPAAVLIEEADDKRADLLCVGPDAGLTRGPRIGRVASRVLREAPCSVLVSRLSEADFPSRIVCGIDGSEVSADLAALAVATAAATRAEIQLVHAIPLLEPRARRRIRFEAITSREPERSMRAAKVRGVVPTHAVVRGRADRALVSVTKRDRSDLLVVGHRGMSGAPRMLLGSVSEYCAQKALCSVLVSRPPELFEASQTP
jgi:nucleotide-binding universal stress UspA family protein